jgi:hypothetical protein
MYLCGNIINVSIGRSHDASMLQQLWDTLQLWVVERPDCMQPIIELYINNNDLLPVIIFGSSSASMYRTASMFNRHELVMLIQRNLWKHFLPHGMRSAFWNVRWSVAIRA